MRLTETVCLTTLALLICGASTHAEGPVHRRLSAVPFTAVKFNDTFWAPRLETNAQKSLPHNFKWCEDTGRIANFAKAGGLTEGKFEGIYFNDSDVYKVLEGASYWLAQHPDPALEHTVDAVIAKIAAAQQADGYLNTYFTLVKPNERWTNLPVMHELYCAGHLFEAATAHYRATGKRTLLDVAVRFADCIDRIFGPGKRCGVPGHEEIELGLVKLYETTGQQRYLDLAKFFLDVRGDKSKREIAGAYCQDHMPVREQREIVGHAVRAMYLYAGVADMAAYTGDQGFVEAMHHLWEDVVKRKMYITGGIGARHQGEAFGDPYELPNATAYCETCAAIGLALWSQRMNLMHADAQYADVLERVLYNGFLAGVGLDGGLFFYVNPLASGGNHHRQPFFSCACCPTNVVRLVPSLPGYVYAQDGQSIYVNLYVAGTAEVALGEANVKIVQQTQYPWDGAVKLAVDPAKPRAFAIRLRIPGWSGGATVAVNGRQVASPVTEKGYARLQRQWQPGDTIELNLPMEVQRMEAHPAVEADRGRVAVQRGPIVYCFEGVDNCREGVGNDGSVPRIVLAGDPKFNTRYKADFLDGVTIIGGVDRSGREVRAVPYYAWGHRTPCDMAVWVWQDGKSRTPEVNDPSWQGKLYRPLDPASLGPPLQLTAMELSAPSASHCSAGDTVLGLCDGILPKDSSDRDIPRFTWWDHRGTTEWVQYDFGGPQKVSTTEVYWFDDGRVQQNCRVPKSWRLLYRDGDQWKPVAGVAAYGTELDKFNRVEFQMVETTALRIEVELNAPWSGGILEWNVE
jgi:DUF1680 family protein